MYSTTEIAQAMNTLATHPTRVGDSYHRAWDAVEWADRHLTEYEQSQVARIQQEMAA